MDDLEVSRSFYEILTDSIGVVNALVWGPPMLVLLLGVGAFLTVGLRFMPILRIPYGFAQLFRGGHRKEEGDVSPFGALMTALSSTIGTGNIAGVAVAIAIGGPGALFWMWMTALVGMATKYAEGVLAVRYREVDAQGRHVGGPMYYIRNGLGPKFLWLAGTFAVFGILGAWGTGASVQANSVADAMQSTFNVNPILTAVFLAGAAAAVILGGIRRIAHVASGLVPAMAAFYLLGGIAVLVMNIEAVPGAFALVVKSALTYEAAEGGFFGSAFWLAMRFGVARGIFSNEAGQGSAPIAHAAARNKDPVNQGVIAMLGTFIDTLIVCTITGLVIVSTGAYQLIDPSTGDAFTGAPLTAAAFDSSLPFGQYIVAVGLALFAFTTILGWSYYGERCAEYLFGENAVVPFRMSWIVVVFLSASILALEPRQATTEADGVLTEFAYDFEGDEKSDVIVYVITGENGEVQLRAPDESFELAPSGEEGGMVVMNAPPEPGATVLVVDAGRQTFSNIVNLFWLVADTMTGLMAAPNLIGLALLSPLVFAMTREYFTTGPGAPAGRRRRDEE